MGRPRPAAVAASPTSFAAMSDAASLPEAITEPVAAINDDLRSFVAGRDLPGNLKEAILYALLGPGKRIRPVLSWHCAAAVGGLGESSLPAGSAVELIHAFSLVHDDLPALDNDDLRRGRPTLHVHAGEPMAILAGDAMLTLAFQCIVERVADAPLADALSRELGDGTSAMIAGQVYDTLGGMGSHLPEAEKLDLIHRKKTGALIAAACRMGAMCGGALGRPEALEAITRYADAIGLMFQIVDDLLDVTQSTEHTGKRTGKDAEAGKLTFPLVHGIERSRQKVRELHAEALEALSGLESTEPLRELASYLAVRTR